MSAGEVIMKNELCFVSQIASRDTSAESVHNIIDKFERWVSLKLMQLFTFYQRKTKNSRFDAPKKYHTSVRDEFTLINFIATCGCFIQWKCVYIYFTATDVCTRATHDVVMLNGYFSVWLGSLCFTRRRLYCCALLVGFSSCSLCCWGERSCHPPFTLRTIQFNWNLFGLWLRISPIHFGNWMSREIISDCL